MYTELIRKKVFEQSKVYQALKSGDTSSVQYTEYYDIKWGTGDANYKNRMCLAYYLLYANIDDEDVIGYYIDIKQFEIAYSYLRRMIDTTDFKEIERIRLFSDVLEECFEIICGGAKASLRLWKWAKPYLQKKTNMYGNLYTKGISAAKIVNDSYAVQLEQEYIEWKKKMGVK